MVESNRLLQEALRLASLGYRVFPCVPNEKRPLTQNGCKNATTDEDQICEWWSETPNANVGLSTNGLLVVDIDGKDNPWLTDKAESLSSGAISETPSGGRHYVFKQPPDKELGNSIGTLDKRVDTRGNGGYIIVAPSVVDNKPYRWLESYELNESVDNLSVVPEWIIEALNCANHEPVKLEGEKIPYGVQHKTLFRHACYQRRSGMSFSEINAALQTINQERCEKPGTQKAIENIARSASNYKPDQITVAFIEDHYSQIQEQEEKFTWVTAAELDSGDYELEYQIPGILVSGQPCIIAGPKKCLKTNLLIDLGVSLSSGSPFLGKFFINKPVNTAIISCESGKAVIQETSRRVIKSKQLLPSRIENLFYSFDRPALNNEIDILQLKRIIEEKQIKVLILDPAYLALSLGDAASNLFSVGEKLIPLTELGQETDCTIILVHHTRKSKGTNEFDEPQFEEIAFAGFQEWMRQWILLNRREAYQPDNPGVHKLHFVAGGSAGHSVFWGIDIHEGSIDDEGGRVWDVEVKTASVARAESRSHKDQQKDQRQEAQFEANVLKVVESLESLGGEATKSKIRNKAVLSPDKTEQALLHLLSEGVIEQAEITAANKQKYAGYKFSSNHSGSLVKTSGPDCQSTHTQIPPIGGSVSVCVSDLDYESLDEAFPTDSEGDYF